MYDLCLLIIHALNSSIEINLKNLLIGFHVIFSLIQFHDTNDENPEKPKIVHSNAESMMANDSNVGFSYSFRCFDASANLNTFDVYTV